MRCHLLDSSSLALALALTVSTLAACGSPQSPGPGTAGQASVVGKDAEQPESEAEAPAAEPTQPERLLWIGFTPTPDDPSQPYQIGGEPAAQAEPLLGLAEWDCRQTQTKPPPCGWAKQCGALGLRWADQLGLSEDRQGLANFAYQEDCSDAGKAISRSESGDFVAHAAVIRHETQALASDGVASLLVNTGSTWQVAARIREVATEGMSVQRVHGPQAAWQLELDEHPGKELVLLITGRQIVGDAQEAFARVVVCHVSPELECRRLDVSTARRLEIYDDGRFVIDEREGKRFDELAPATAPLIKP